MLRSAQAEQRYRTMLRIAGSTLHRVRDRGRYLSKNRPEAMRGRRVTGQL